jgi:hypothetical protein
MIQHSKTCVPHFPNATDFFTFNSFSNVLEQ